MAKLTTNYTDISYVAEATPGVTPATPAFQILPTTGGSPELKTTTQVSEAIRSDRQIDDLIPVDAEVIGDLNFELSYAPYKPLLQQILRPTAGPSDAVINGNKAPQTYTFCKRVVASATTYYFYYTGVVLGNLKLSFSTGSRLTGSISVIGETETPTETGIVGQTFVQPPAHVIMNSVDNILDLSLTGLPANTCFKSLELTIDNSSTGAKCIGVYGNSEVADFGLNITGSIETYFEDLVLYQKFKAAEAFAMAIELKDGLDNELKMTFPKCKFEELSVPIPGKDQFLTMPGTLRALRDQALGYTAKFEFTDAP